MHKKKNNTTPASATWSSKSGGDPGPQAAGGRRVTSAERGGRHSGRQQPHPRRKGSKQEGEPRPPTAPVPEGCGEPRPLLYGGGDEAAAIVSRWEP